MPKHFFQDLPREVRDQIYLETALSVNRPAFTRPRTNEPFKTMLNKHKGSEVVISCEYFDLAVQNKDQPKREPLIGALLVNKQFSQEFKEVFDRKMRPAPDESPEIWKLDCIAVASRSNEPPFFKLGGLLRYMRIPATFRRKPGVVTLNLQIVLDKSLRGTILQLPMFAVPPFVATPVSWVDWLVEMIIEIGTQILFSSDSANLATLAAPPKELDSPHEMEIREAPGVTILVQTRKIEASVTIKNEQKPSQSNTPNHGQHQPVRRAVLLDLITRIGNGLGGYFGSLALDVDGQFSRVSPPFNADEFICEHRVVTDFHLSFDYSISPFGHHLHRVDIPSHGLVHGHEMLYREFMAMSFLG